MSNFTAATGTGGTGYDFTYFLDTNATIYAQWAGWRRVMHELRVRHGSDWVVE